MPTPFTDWLSHVAVWLPYIALIFGALDAIFHHADHMLGSVLSMCARVRKFRRSMARMPVRPRLRAAERPTKKDGDKSSTSST